jgi:AcrR family transcriptional regulator
MNRSKKYLQSEKSKRHIIDATIHLMATKGYGYTSISDISEATGLTKGALYHHFSNKEELFEVSVAYIADIIEDKLLSIGMDQASSSKILGVVFDVFIDLFEENYHYALTVSSLILELETGRSPVTRPLIDMLDKFSVFLERIISKGQLNRELNSDFEAKLVALNIIGVFFGNTLPWIMNKDRTNYRAIMESQKKILLTSLKP